MSFTWRWYVAYAVKLTPSDNFRIVRPYIVEPLCTIGATKSVEISTSFQTGNWIALQVKLIIPAHNGVVRPSRRYLSFWRATLVAGLDEHFPFTIGVL